MQMNEIGEGNNEINTKIRIRFLKPFSPAPMITLVLVPRAGIEPALPKEQDFESSASTSSATGAS